MSQPYRVGKVIERGLVRLGNGRLIALRTMPRYRIDSYGNFGRVVRYRPPPKGSVLFDGRGRWGSKPIRRQTAEQLARVNAKRERNSKK